MLITDNISTHFRLTGQQVKALQYLELKTIEDLLMHIPTRYEDVGNARNIRTLQSGINSNDTVILYGAIKKLDKKLSWKTKRYIIEAVVTDDTGNINIKWFNQSYIVDTLKYAKYVKITGKLTGSGTSAYFANPIIEIMPGLPQLRSADSDTPPYPIYKTTYGISSRWFYYTIRKILSSINLENISDPIPFSILNKYNLPTLDKAILWSHTPKTNKESTVATKRFAFNEVFYLQILAAQARYSRSESNTYKITDAMTLQKGTLKDFIDTYPFKLTGAQALAIESIITDMRSGKPMARLLEGDVGSGKTAVAAAVSFTVVCDKLQVSYMAPTEVLATQLFESFIEYFKSTNIQIGLLTGSGCKKFPSKTNPNEATKISKNQLLKWVADGSIDILIGTHALIQKNVKFKHLALAIIDEQHRFGTQQRALMLENNIDYKIPHLLSMTATPIPRTLALTIYGDLDLSIIGEMPSGRKKVITKIVGASKLREVYSHIDKEIRNGRQAYVICPKVNKSELSEGSNQSTQKAVMSALKSVTEEVQALKKIFPKLTIEALHGKLKPKEKEEIMQLFANGEIDILVATSVVEVGVNVPNATVMLIEGAERFGLSQLHQLRGRVIRSNHQSYCYLTTTTEKVSEATRERLKALVEAKNGFELAEIDLKLRGAGDLRGDSQWGLGDIAMDAIKNIKMVEAARREARLLIDEDPTLAKHKKLAEIVSKRGNIHLE